MPSLTYRLSNGKALTWSEVDENFRQLDHAKVDKRAGYGLSQENFSATDKQKLDSAPENIDYRLSQAEENSESAASDASAANSKANSLLAPDDASKGPGAIPFDSELDYPDGSVGAALKGEGGLSQRLAAPDGTSQIGSGDQTLEQHLSTIDAKLFGIEVLSAPADGSDVTAQVVAFFNRAKERKSCWFVPPGDYTINPGAPISITTSGTCSGRFLLPKSNQTFYFYVCRDEPGSVISTAGWAFAPNRGNSSVGAFNAVGKNLFIASTEILMERFGEGGPYTPYFKQEFIRCPLFNGSFSTAAVRNYIDLSKMIVTAHTPSKPIEVSGLGVLLTGASGGVESNRGSIVVMRDNAVINQPYIHNENPGQPKPIALEVSYCADVTINQPDILGFNYPGLGYGILSGTAIGLTINGGSVQDCRHAYTDAFTVDTIINGGSWSYVIDSHWCDRFTANDVNVSALPGSSAFSMCGDDITLNRPKQSGGRNLLGIRTDTPQMGGQIKIIAPEINSFGVGSDSFYIFGFTSPGGTGPIGGVYTQRPRLPDLVEISDVKFTSDAEILYGARLGTLQAAHTAWGVVKLSGVWTMSGQTTIGIYAEKNSNFQQDRAPLLINDAYMDCGSNGTAIYVSAADGVTTRAMNVRLSNLVRGSLRYSGHGVNVLKASKSSILSIVDDNPSAPSIGMSAFNDCLMLGGAVSTTLKNLSFQGSQFTGNYATFPLAANVTMVGNVKSSTVTGLPADIRGNVAPPFN